MPNWHLGFTTPAILNIGVPTVGVVVTVWVAVLGPLQPAALAVIIEVPDQFAAKLSVPDAVRNEFPGKLLVAPSIV